MCVSSAFITKFFNKIHKNWENQPFNVDRVQWDMKKMKKAMKFTIFLSRCRQEKYNLIYFMFVDEIVDATNDVDRRGW